ncbi:MAG TPA: hypothetical protein VEF89_11030 [Solirubrobacteraceae bacterium]|nr:hypothetical protein [Solirubrobacteraceae bacterium]
MRDRHGRPRSTALERDLARLADGTLAGPRRELAEWLVARSPALQRRLSEQRWVVAATRAAAQRERAPLSVRMRHRALSARPARRRARWLTPRRLGLGLGAPAVTLATILALIAGGEPGLTVAQAATLAARPAVATVAEPPDGRVTLPRLRAAGLPFPYWEDRFGWRATGARTDRIDGRVMTTVFYRRGAQRIAYTIVSGKPLATGAGVRTLTRARTQLASFSTAGGQRVVTWLRQGHTCVLSGRDVPAAALFQLAAWRAHGRIPY